nr:MULTISPECIES: hypothetical protein [unclassified Microbacterium]
MLATRGFVDVHFIHGSYEFGKDVIAKRPDPNGVLQQYAIQAKAGDIGQPEWRAVRPQLDEAGYNTRSHPNFDKTLPRVAVLLTTGRLKGAAAVDAQEYAESAVARGLTRVEVWDKEMLTGWLVSDPAAAMLTLSDQVELQRILADARSGSLDEPQLEQYSRRWGSPGLAGAAAVECAVIVHVLREGARLDLAAAVALHFFRGLRTSTDGQAFERQKEAARALFLSLCSLLRDAIRPLLNDPADLVRIVAGPTAPVSYAVIAVRATELLALGALVTPDAAEQAGFEDIVFDLATRHPGASRPVSDQFAVSPIPITCVLHRRDPQAAAAYLRSIGRWLLDRSDPALNGLGLGTMDEAPLSVTSRLLAGALEATTLEPSRMSYVLTVLLDLCLAVGRRDLFAALYEDSRTLHLVPSTTTVPADAESFRRAGGPVRPVPRLEYAPDGSTTPTRRKSSGCSSRDTLLLVAACRSRHYTDDIIESLRHPV